MVILLYNELYEEIEFNLINRMKDENHSRVLDLDKNLLNVFEAISRDENGLRYYYTILAKAVGLNAMAEY